MADNSFKLKCPIEYNGETYEEVTFSENLKLKHIKHLPVNFSEKYDNGEITFEILMPIVAGLANMPVKALEELDYKDIDIISEGMKDFF